jgi:hypothetical protein
MPRKIRKSRRVNRKSRKSRRVNRKTRRALRGGTDYLQQQFNTIRRENPLTAWKQQIIDASSKMKELTIEADIMSYDANLVTDPTVKKTKLDDALKKYIECASVSETIQKTDRGWLQSELLECVVKGEEVKKQIYKMKPPSLSSIPLPTAKDMNKLAMRANKYWNRSPGMVSGTTVQPIGVEVIPNMKPLTTNPMTNLNYSLARRY